MNIDKENFREQLDVLMENGEFRPFGFWRELFLDRDLLPDYYNVKRHYMYDSGNAIKNMNWRLKLHPVLVKSMEFGRKFINKQTMEVIKDLHTEGEKPVIYAITHIGKFDYQVVSEVLRHQVPFVGDPETMYRTGDGFLLGLNGLVYCDTEDKIDRKVAAATAVDYLKNGNNLTIYPEGVWNLTPNLLMLPLYPGVIKMAEETGCDIVPVAIEQYDSHFIINIGKNFKVEDRRLDSKEEHEKYIEDKKFELRDEMATLKWEIFETLPMEERKSIGDYAKKRKEFVDTRLNEWFDKKNNRTFYNEELVKHRTFKPKNITFAEDAFSYLYNIKLNKNNAFMFGKDVIYPVDFNKEEFINKKR